jgi:EamA domain-containing membrane protein RarD
VDWGAVVVPGSLVTGLGYALIRSRLAQPRRRITSPEAGATFLEGVAMFPMALLILTSVSDGLASFLMAGADRTVLCAAGVVAIFALVDRERKR